MAEICLDCWNKMNKTNHNKRKYIVSKQLDLCEDCGEWKHVIIMERKAYYMRKFRYLILPFRIFFYILYFVFRLLLLPYLIFKYYKSCDKDNL